MAEALRTPRVVVVGAGAAGLLAAVAARRLGHQVLVLERSSELGGSTATTDGAGWCCRFRAYLVVSQIAKPSKD